MWRCAFTSPVIIELGMLVMYCMFVMSVSVVSMVSCCFLVLCTMLAIVMSLKCFCVYFEKLYFCVGCVDDLWCLDVCECRV